MSRALLLVLLPAVACSRDEGRAQCALGQAQLGEACVCQPPTTRAQPDGTCACPAGRQLIDGACVCRAPTQPQPDGTCGCPDGTQVVEEACQVGCAAGSALDPATNACVAQTPAAPAGGGADPMGTGEGEVGGMGGTTPTVEPAPLPAGPTCATADTNGDTYDALQTVLTTRCGVCHRRSQAVRSAGLQLTGNMATDRVDDLVTLVDRPACEVNMPIVDRRGGDEGLWGSWLYWKVAGPADEVGAILPREGLTATGADCMQAMPGSLGGLMPFGATEPIASVELVVRNWLCAGAPGPRDSAPADGAE